MKESINKHVDKWRESLNLFIAFCLVLFRIEAQSDFSLYCDQGYHFQVGIRQRPR